MRNDLRWLVVLAGNALFLWIVAQVNHYLTYISLDLTRAGLGMINAPLYLHLFMLGLPVAFAALRLSLGYGLAVIIPTALFAEAGLPIPNGTLLIASAFCLCTTQAVRANFNRLEPTSALLAALVINLVLMTALTLAAPPGGGLSGSARIAFDLILSQLVLAALAGWFFAWQLALLRVFGFNLETELREPL